ncbi:SF1B family DNA helicase RecD2 [Alteribacter natronophilus]|uniref:SF1B family DNA helicase RecD2 n=1 Tax=Alteribacter natronophilus TaxID=2583810 RepID=UPI00110DE7BC|nr:ATP-dependent RecD-like DNA helicase [Alteribacter natronophilus]TMW73953.1 ATP-dependent RecD-like DNA helicase [Alteribacter natronophilus]
MIGTEETFQTNHVKGELLHLIYHNEESLYTVAKVKVIETSLDLSERELTVVGVLPKPEHDVTYLYHGEMKDHPRFGRQFKAEQVRKEVPQTKHGIVHYLSSERFPGVGQKTAEKIVDELGENALSAILADKGILERVNGLKQDKADQIYKVLVEEQGVEQVLLTLYDYGFGLQLAMKVFQAYKLDAMRIIEENPYQMIEDVEGIGFAKADAIGQKQGLTGNHPDRIKAAIFYVLTEQSMNNGHVYTPTRDVLLEAQRLLSGTERVSEDDIARQIIEMGEEDKVKVEEDRMYLNTLYFAEKGIVTNLHRLITRGKSVEEFPESEFLKALGKTEESLGIEYADSQKEAIRTALTSGVTVLTGGPGTGKTTVINGLVEVYGRLKGLSVNPDDYKKDDQFPVILAAPTGRAAKRMSESTGLPASTIHRLLGYKGNQDDLEYGDHQQLEGNLIILDEMSMVDTWLCNQLLRAVPDEMQVLFVGDEDQLPSVGPGQVLSDILKAQIVPSVQLTAIFRQAEGSSIITFSHDIKDGNRISAESSAGNDLRFIPCGPPQVPDAVRQICEKAVARGYSARDIQVLAPMYRGDAGVTALNQMLQELFNPPKEQKREVAFGDVVYRHGDMVLQLVNNPEENVYNGDRGEIVAIFLPKETEQNETMIVISFDGIEVAYSKSDLNQITHAYCCSIHKSQGSEFPIVVMPVIRNYARMLRKNLIYTGVTRAKDFLLLCGDWGAVELAVGRDDDLVRNTTLRKKLKEAFMEATNQHEKTGAAKD